MTRALERDAVSEAQPSEQPGVLSAREPGTPASSEGDKES
jgi:hypothetical protein